MSRERAMVARARPQMSTAMAAALIRDEALKGCTGELYPEPVRLEPPYRDFARLDAASSDQSLAAECALVCAEGELQRYTLWVPPGLECKWHVAERFLKETQACRCPLRFEICGNAGGVTLSLAATTADAPLLEAAFKGEYNDCEIAPIEKPKLASIPPENWSRAVFREYFPPPPYSHLFTRPSELGTSPLTRRSRNQKVVLHASVFTEE